MCVCECMYIWYVIYGNRSGKEESKKTQTQNRNVMYESE